MEVHQKLGHIHNKRDGINMLDKKLIDKIVEKQGDLLYTTLAEECTELAQACCKINRNKFLKKDIKDNLNNFFEEICDVQINLQAIKQQVLKETGMSSAEYEQYIKTWEYIKKDKLQNIFIGTSIEELYNKLSKAGYIDKATLEPIACTYCGSKELEDRDFYKEECYVVEYSKYCKHCGKKLGTWSYGNWESF